MSSPLLQLQHYSEPTKEYAEREEPMMIPQTTDSGPAIDNKIYYDEETLQNTLKSLLNMEDNSKVTASMPATAPKN